MTNPNTPQDPLLSMRLALILLAALIIGSLFGTLTYFATLVVAQALLAGVTAALGGVVTLDKLIGR